MIRSVVLLAVALLAACSSAPSPSPSVDPYAVCATGPAAMLTSADLGAFTQFGDGPMAGLGLHGIGPHPIDAAFVAGRSRMWVVTIALSGRYRADNDAYARSLGYPVESLPLIPLVGAIVAEHPAEPLTVYERVLMFKDAGWATQWLAMDRSNVVMQGTSTVNGVPQPTIALAPLRLGDESVAVIQPPSVGGRVATTGSIHVEVRVGRTVVGVTVDGGTGLRVEQAQAIAQTALARNTTTCVPKGSP